MHKTVIIACSNGRSQDDQIVLKCLKLTLSRMGIQADVLDGVYERAGEDPILRGAENAGRLMSIFKNDSYEYIFDVSGGDLTNTILPFLDFPQIKKSRAVFWGYSDLTVLINTLYSMTNKISVLYQPRHAAAGAPKYITDRFCSFLQNAQQHLTRSVTLHSERKSDVPELLSLSGSFISGHSMEGILVGGNLRCFLKLAGTPYFPGMNGKILLIESLGGGVQRIASYLMQLYEMGVFEQISGIVLGTFTEMQRSASRPTPSELILSLTNGRLPVFVTPDIGHAKDAKAALIGCHYSIS